MNDDRLRFGVAGLGGIGAVRAQALQKSVSCTLAAVCDIDAGRTAPWAPSATVFSDFDDLVASDECDAIIVCTPPDMHREMAISAMRTGKHVLVEKPMAESLASCEDMLEVAEETRRVLTVGYNHRYFKGVEVVRQALVDREIGNLHFLRAFTGHTGLSEFKAPWMYDRKVMGGGTLLDNGTHIVDLAASLMGEITSVEGIVSNDIWNLDVEDNAFLRLTDANGVHCELQSSWTEWKGYRFYIEAYGDKGMVQMYYAPMFARLVRMSDDRLSSTSRRWFFWSDILKEKFRGWQSTVIETFLQEFEDFVALTRGRADRSIIATGADGCRAIRLANAAYESSLTGVPVGIRKQGEHGK